MTWMGCGRTPLWIVDCRALLSMGHPQLHCSAGPLRAGPLIVSGPRECAGNNYRGTPFSRRALLAAFPHFTGFRTSFHASSEPGSL